MAFFEEHGVKLKTERGKRVFPESDDANDIAEALERFAVKNGVEIITESVKEILIDKDNGKVTGVETNKAQYSAKDVVVSAGGASYPGTGSDGSGYKLAKKVGHEITEIIPSLVPLVENGDTCKSLQGLSLKNISIKVINESGKAKPVYEDFGELLFTHFGLSGPVVLSASAHMREKNARYIVRIDLKPALDESKLDARILRDFEKNKNKDFANSLSELLPKKMIPVIIERSGIEPERKCNAITKEERKSFVNLVKNFDIKISGFRPINEAIITSGGVSTKEINPKTMESKLVKGLYFAGEIIDVDAYTGGFNLQIAFSTGYAVAMAIIAND